jgi:hypothetical protein
VSGGIVIFGRQSVVSDAFGNNEPNYDSATQGESSQKKNQAQTRVSLIHRSTLERMGHFCHP